MIQADPAVLEALHRLQFQADFHAVLSWCSSSLEDIDQTLRAAEDDRHLRQLQGAAQVLDEILKTAATATQVLKKLKGTPD